MASAKYGRLFTEEDVKHLLLFAAQRGEGIGVEALGRDPNGFPINVGGRLLIEWEEAMAALGEREILVPHRLTFPADEPLFLLRGQDAAAPRALADDVDGELDYLGASRAMGAGQDHLLKVARDAEEMRQWQAANPGRVKVPS